RIGEAEVRIAQKQIGNSGTSGKGALIVGRLRADAEDLIAQQLKLRVGVAKAFGLWRRSVRTRYPVPIGRVCDPRCARHRIDEENGALLIAREIYARAPRRDECHVREPRARNQMICRSIIVGNRKRRPIDGGVAGIGHRDQPFSLIRRAFCLFQSRLAASWRLSEWFFPCASPIFTLARPFLLKYISSGTSVMPLRSTAIAIL